MMELLMALFGVGTTMAMICGVVYFIGYMNERFGD